MEPESQWGVQSHCAASDVVGSKPLISQRRKTQANRDEEVRNPKKYFTVTEI